MEIRTIFTANVVTGRIGSAATDYCHPVKAVCDGDTRKNDHNETN